MDAAEFLDFLFNTYTGMGILIGVCLVVCVIACFIMERKTRKTFVDRPASEDDWSFFDDDDDEEESA